MKMPVTPWWIFIIIFVFSIHAEGLSPPIIDSFIVNTNPIIEGDKVSLSWMVNADETTRFMIDGGVGPVKYHFGSIEVSPTVTTTYTLTASNEAGSDSKTAQVVVVKDPNFRKKIVLNSIPSIGGNIWAGKWNWRREVGDTNDDQGIKNAGIRSIFIFDISSIPSNTGIDNVEIEFSDYHSFPGSNDPFSDLGCLNAYYINPSSTFIGNYDASSSYGPMFTICDIKKLDKPFSSESLAKAIKEDLGKRFFSELRLQFEKETDGDNEQEGISFGPNVKLIIHPKSRIGSPSWTPDPP